MAPPAQLRRDREGEDLGLVHHPARQDEARRGIGLPDEEPIGRHVPLAEQALEFQRAPGRAKPVSWIAAEAGRRPRVEGAAMRAGGGGKNRSRRLMPIGSSPGDPRPVLRFARRVRAGRAAWAGRRRDPRWRRDAPPRRCRARRILHHMRLDPLRPGLGGQRRGGRCRRSAAARNRAAGWRPDRLISEGAMMALPPNAIAWM